MGWKNGEETGDEVGWGGVHVGGGGGGGGTVTGDTPHINCQEFLRPYHS